MAVKLWGGYSSVPIWNPPLLTMPYTKRKSLRLRKDNSIVLFSCCKTCSKTEKSQGLHSSSLTHMVGHAKGRSLKLVEVQNICWAFAKDKWILKSTYGYLYAIELNVYLYQLLLIARDEIFSGSKYNFIAKHWYQAKLSKNLSSGSGV